MIKQIFLFPVYILEESFHNKLETLQQCSMYSVIFEFLTRTNLLESGKQKLETLRSKSSGIRLKLEFYIFLYLYFYYIC